MIKASKKGGSIWLRIGKIVLISLMVILTVIFFLAALGSAAYAAGLVDETVNTANEYSKYSLDHYQLDFYVDNGWDWLPWNWSDGIGKQVNYGLYAITNFIWTISLYLSNATGYLIQEAYSLDFISATADSIGQNMQTLAGVSSRGFSSDGFYTGFLLIIILVVGIYVAYTGLIKRETTRAIHAVINFVVVFVLSAAFIAYAPDYIKKVNEFSADISNASLTLGTKIVMPSSDSKGKDSVDLIRDSLFSIQVQQPWLLLQFNDSDMDSIGADRVEDLLSVSPDENNGEDREEVVKEEIEDRDNSNLTITKTINRLGTVFFLFIFNLGISVFVFLLTGIMLFSQVLFIIYAMFLPMSFILSMIPSFEGMAKQAVTKLFNTILTRAGITLVITIAFSISTMLYKLSAGYPFFLIAFLQIVTFAGIYFKLGDLMSMFSLQSGDSQGVGRQIMRKPRMLMHRRMNRLQRSLGRSVSALGNAGTGKSKKLSKPILSRAKATQPDHSRPDQPAIREKNKSLGARAGQKVGAVLDAPSRILDTASQLKDQAKDLPVNAKYALYNGKKQMSEGVHDFTASVNQTRADRSEGRKNKQKQHRQTIAERRSEMAGAKRPLHRQHKPVTHAYDRSAGNVSHERSNGYAPIDRTAQAEQAAQSNWISQTNNRPVVTSYDPSDRSDLQNQQPAAYELQSNSTERQNIKKSHIGTERPSWASMPTHMDDSVKKLAESSTRPQYHVSKRTPRSKNISTSKEGNRAAISSTASKKGGTE